MCEMFILLIQPIRIGGGVDSDYTMQPLQTLLARESQDSHTDC